MKEETMNRQRFEALAEAFGGDIDRWPTADQAAARAFWSAEPQAADAALRAALDLDAILAAAPEPEFSVLLRERLMVAAPGRHRSVWRSARTWVSGAGLAAACAAGILVGANFSDRIVGDPTLEALGQTATSFDAPADLVGFGDVG
ncbi:hypothetical protein BH11PSE2_BH11PSE2_06480 [soil metagenome]